jgi:hypothetical protein
MQSATNNPPQNVIGAGLTDNKVEEAVRRSGYPLQTVVATMLSPDFSVTEEWSYIDSENLRTLDIMAEKDFWDHNNQLRVRPTLNLLIECKQSDMPYIFFKASTDIWLPNFPVLGGLFHDEIVATTDDDASSFRFRIQDLMGCTVDQFVRSGPPNCTSFSKCARKGSNVELSGADPFNSLVLPLIKAMQHFKAQAAPPTTAHYHDLHMVLGVAVLDAPMISVEVNDTGQDLTYEPWVRVIRNEATEGRHWMERRNVYAIDVVHKSYFKTYVEDHVLPFAERVSAKALRHPVEIVTGEAFVPSLGTDFFPDFNGMTPRTMLKRASRIRAFWRMLNARITSGE